MNFTQKKKMVTEILNTVPKEFPIKRDLVNFIQQYMVDHHQHINSLSITKLWVKKNSGFNHNNFYFNGTMNGEYVTSRLLGTSNVSKNKTINIENKRLTQAMREAISKDLYEYKKLMLDVYKQQTCAICNSAFDNMEQVHVDHCGEKEFRHIKDEFLSVEPKLEIEERDYNDDGMTKLIDNEDKELWIKFHHLSCNLQLICKHCNLSKEKK